MRKIRGGAAAISLLMTLTFVAGAQAAITTSNITAPSDGTLLLLNQVTNPTQTFTVSGTTNGTTGDRYDIDCYSGNTEYHRYQGPSNAGLAVNSDGSFSVTNVPLATFATGTCHLVVVPHGTTPPPGTSYTGPRVGFSDFQSYKLTSGANSGTAYDFGFDDVTMLASASINSIDDCGPYTDLVDGTSAMNVGPLLFYCGASFYNSPSDFGTSRDLTRSEIEVDGQNAYGSSSAAGLFTGSNAIPGFPALTASLDSFSSSTGDAQTTESEPLVECTPNNGYAPTSSSCTAFGSTGVTIKRVTHYSNSGRVQTVIDTFSSTDGAAHSLDLQYETDLNATSAGWEFPGQTSFSQESTGQTLPAASAAPLTVYSLYNTAAPPSLSNPVGAMTFVTPYSGVTFDNTLWGGEDSALFDFQKMVPAGGSISIAVSYATGTSLTEVQGYVAPAEDVMQAPAVTISSPSAGATLTSSPVTVTGSVSAGSGVKSVTVNDVPATVTGGSWSASVPLNQGSNTLTATLTSDAGNTASATAAVTYAPPARVSLKSKRFNGKAVLVKLACAASGSACAGKVTLRYTETVVKHHKRHRTTVTIASKRYGIGYGKTATVSAGLNGTGRRLLKEHGKLRVAGLVTVTQRGGQTEPAASFKLTLKQPHRKHRK